MNSTALFQKTYLSCKMGQNEFISSPQAELQRQTARKFDKGDALKGTSRTTNHSTEDLWHQELSSRCGLVCCIKKFLFVTHT